MELGICLYKRCRSALDRMSFGLSSARAFRDFVFYPWPIVLGPYGAKRCGCKMTRHFYPWLAVLGRSGAKQCGCKMIAFTLSPLSFTFTHVWARWLLAGLGALVGFVGLDFSPLTFRWLSVDSQACRQVNFGVHCWLLGFPNVVSGAVFVPGASCWFLGLSYLQLRALGFGRLPLRRWRGSLLWETTEPGLAA
jgi:hypothetical protein